MRREREKESPTLLTCDPAKPYRLSAAARILGINDTTIRKRVKAGKIRTTLDKRIMGSELIRIGGIVVAEARFDAVVPTETARKKRLRNDDAELEAIK